MTRTAVFSYALAVALLAGCDMTATQSTLEGLTWDEVSADVARASDDAFAEQPFRRGVIAVVFPEDGNLSSDRLYPCQTGGAVCLNSPRGPSATVQRTDRHYILQFSSGQTYFLRPGGGGTLRTASGDVALAWNAYVNGVPVWPQPIWPYTPWISQVEPGPNP